MACHSRLVNAGRELIAQGIFPYCDRHCKADPGFTAAASRQRSSPAIRFDGGFIFCLQTD